MVTIRVLKAWACSACDGKGADRGTARIHANQTQHIVVFTETLQPQGYKPRGLTYKQLRGY